jgi:hypothetical protein
MLCGYFQPFSDENWREVTDHQREGLLRSRTNRRVLENRHGHGLVFTAIDPQQMGVLEKWLGELSGSAPTELSVTHEHPPSPSNGGCAKEPGYVLNDLIVALMRKGTLSEEEGRTMLLRLVHHDFRP